MGYGNNVAFAGVWVSLDEGIDVRYCTSTVWHCGFFGIIFLDEGSAARPWGFTAIAWRHGQLF